MDHPRSEQTAMIVGASRGLRLGLAKEYLKPGVTWVCQSRPAFTTMMTERNAEPI